MSNAGNIDIGSVDEATSSDAIVIDVGSTVSKVGFSGEDSPRSRFTTVIGLNTENVEADLTNPTGDIPEQDERTFYGGESVLSRRKSLNLTKPKQKTVIHDWDALEKLWEWSFAEELNVDPEAFPVLVMDSVLENKKSRETMAKIMFEKFNVKSFYIATEAVLSLFSSGVTSGLILESGDEVSRAVPVFEGYPLRHAVSSTRVASRNVYASFGRALQAANPNHQLPVDFLDANCLANQLKEKHVYLNVNGRPTGGRLAEDGMHELPDGSIIHIPESVCTSSGELLFDPKSAGIHDQKSVVETLLKSMQLCDNDLQRQFINKVFVGGGTAMVGGFAARIQAELQPVSEANFDFSKVKVPSDRHLMDASWTGGSMLASLSTFSHMKIRKQEYDDSHAVIVHRKCF
jgi:actin-related protein